MKSFAVATVLCAAFASIAFAGPEPLSEGKEMKQVAPAPAPVCDPRWYISIGGGIDIDFEATDFVSDTNFTLMSTTPPSTPQNEIYKGRSWGDVYDPIYRIQGELGYVLNNHVEVFALFKYAGGYGGRFRGDIDLSHVGGTTAFPIVNYFGDYRSWGGELGFRFFLFPKDTIQPWHLRPYVSLSGGATYVESIYVAPRYVSDGYYTYVPAFEGNLYDDSIVGTVAGMLGIEVPIGCHWSVGVEGGVRYESELDNTDVIRRTITDYDPDRATARSFHYQVSDNAGHYNSDGARLYCPLNAYLKFRF